MSDINVTIVGGRLVRNPILRGNGAKVSLFTLASNKRFRDKTDNWREETAFISCKCFGKFAEVVAQHEKGDQIIIEGRLRTEKWEADGTMRYDLVLVADSVQFVSNGHSGASVPPNGGGTDKSDPPSKGGPSEDAPPF